MKNSTASIAVLLTYLIFQIAVHGTSGQSAPVRRPSFKQLLEKYDNPPAYMYRLDTSPRMVSPHGVFVSYQVNVDANGNNIIGDAANECSISVDPTEPAGWQLVGGNSTVCCRTSGKVAMDIPLMLACIGLPGCSGE